MDTFVRQEYLSSYGRNRGRALRPYQQSLVDELLPQLEVKLPINGKAALEIGFGAGEHLLAQAEHHPDTLYVGCEPFINGVAKCLAGIDKQKLKNIRIHTDDVRLLLPKIGEEAFEEIFILFPDPWPKTKHKKRRLVNQETLKMLSRVHKKGGRLLVATDHVDYSEWILEQLLLTPYYKWTAQSPADWLTQPKDWTETKYQRKTSAEGRKPLFFECLRA